jgi:hypothetical protein
MVQPNPELVIKTLVRRGLELIEDEDAKGIFEFSSKGGICIEKVNRDHYVIRFSKSRGHIWDPKRFGYKVKLGEKLNIMIIPEYNEQSSGDS